MLQLLCFSLPSSAKIPRGRSAAPGGISMYSTPQKLSAEFIGTFALIFFGAGAICAFGFLHEPLGTTLLAIAIAHGLAIALMISALGHISGGHFNPAVTIGFWVTKRITTIEAISYWAAQVARAFGPALAANHWANQGVYWVGPLLGGFFAGLLYDSFFNRKP